MILINFFILNVAFISYAKIYDCSVKDTVYLNISEIAFFETTNYPRFLPVDDFKQCGLNFSLANNNKDHRLIVGFLENTHDTNSWLFAGQTFSYLTLNDSFYSLKKNINDNTSAIAQLGHVLFENRSGCPLESISPFTFTDEKHIIFLKSGNASYGDQALSCKWEFFAPDGYGFKIVIQKLNLTKGVQFIVQNKTDIILNGRSVIFYHAYYNADKYIQISLSHNNSCTVPETELQAYISIVKKDINTTICNKCCWHSTIKSEIIWSNIGSTGYGNNIKCTLDLIIPPKMQIVASIQTFAVEYFIDYINYNSLEYGNGTLYGIEKFVILIYPDCTKDQKNVFFKMRLIFSELVFPPHSDASVRHIFWEFLSDGSIESAGFRLKISSILCECADPIVYCDQKVHTIQNGSVYETMFTYCPNLHCNFTLTCDSELTLLNIQLILVNGAGFNDIFRVYSNNVTVYEVSNANSVEISFNIFLNSSNINIFETITFFTPVMTLLLFTVIPFNVPSVDRQIILSPSNPQSIILVEPNKLVDVEISPLLETSDVIMYSNTRPISLYSDNNLYLKIFNEKCFNYLDRQKCELKINHFTIFNTRVDTYPYLVIETSNKFGNCVFYKNVFYLDDSSTDIFNIAILANSYGPCIITILKSVSYNYYISHAWTSSANENIQMYAGIDQANAFFEFNAETAKNLKYIPLQSYVYIILAPKNTAFFLTIKPSASRYPLIKAKNLFKSYIATPLYGNSKLIPIETKAAFVGYEIGDDIVTFTAIKYKVLESDDFYFLTNNNATQLHVNKSGDYVTFQNQTVFLYYSFTKSPEIDNGAVFLVETNKNIKKKMLK